MLRAFHVFNRHWLCQTNNKVSNTTNTRSLRDFHNLYVKNNLLSLVCNPGNILIDYACGKGGDIPKWIQTKLKFILGFTML